MVGDVFMQKTKLHAWELAGLIALCVLFAAGAWASDTQQELASDLVRLHVIARSDSDADQAEKLAVRDKVLAILSPALAGCETREDAVDIILSRQADIEALGDDIYMTLDQEHYPTRDYGAFALPAGEYLSLRITLGAGAGHNWWCVVFPPLCTEALAEPVTDAFALLPEDAAGLITRDGPGYVIRFRVLEWWDALAGLFH